MKVLQYVHSFPPGALGGTETHCFNLTCSLISRGHEVLVIANGPKPCNEENDFSNPNVSENKLQVIWTGNLETGDVDCCCSRKDVERDFERVLNEFKPDVIHFQHLIGGSLKLPVIAEKRGIKVILTIADHWLSCPRGQRLKPDGIHCFNFVPELCSQCLRGDSSAVKKIRKRMKAVKTAINAFDVILAPSFCVARTAIMAGAEQDKIMSFDYGISEVKYKPLPEGRIRIGFLGALIPSKGLDLIFEALRRLEPSKRPLISVKGFSQPWPEAQEYERRIRSEYQESDIIWEKPSLPEESLQWMHGIHALIISSTWPENSPLALAEAWACKRPVIASCAGGLEEMISRGGGMLYKCGSIEDLALKIGTLTEQPDNLSEMIQSIPERWTISEMAEFVESVYMDLLADKEYQSSEIECIHEPTRRSTIIIPTLNGGRKLKKCMKSISMQITEEDEVIIIDSGSSDDTVKEALKYGFTVISIDKNDFGHGRTRKFASETARGKFLVFLVQDAIPQEGWLNSLISRMEKEPKIAGVYSRQTGGAECDPVESYWIDNWMSNFSSSYTHSGPIPDDPWKARLFCNFDNVSAIYRAEVLRENPFLDVPYGEDLRWAKGILKKGYAIGYESSSVVEHFHRKTLSYELIRRYKDHSMNYELFRLNIIRNITAILNNIRYEFDLNKKLMKDKSRTELIRANLITLARQTGTVIGVIASKLKVSFRVF